jgi:hypothetical protein
LLSASTALIHGLIIEATTGCLGGNQDDNNKVSAATEIPDNSALDITKMLPISSFLIIIYSPLILFIKKL